MIGLGGRINFAFLSSLHEFVQLDAATVSTEGWGGVGNRRGFGKKKSAAHSSAAAAGEL